MDRRRNRGLKRLSKELIEVNKEFLVEIEEDDLSVWKVTLPLGSVYGDVIVNLVFGDGYPFDPPKATIPDIWHPNVYPGTQLCISILESRNQEILPGEEGKSAAERWSPALTVFALLQGIVSVILEPNVESPANPEANRDYMSDYKKYTLKNEKLKKIREDRLIRKEQDKSFKQALLDDQQKEEKKAKQEKKAKLDSHMERSSKEARELRQTRNVLEQTKAEASLPPEPEELAHIKFRTPTETLNRRFHSQEPLSVLLLFLRSRGYRPEDYKVLTSFPRRDLTTFPTSTTMVNLEMVPQETLTLEARNPSDSDSEP